MVTIEKLGTDVDALSGKEAEGVYCTFEDQSFSGFLSWKSLKQLLNLKSKQEAKE